MALSEDKYISYDEIIKKCKTRGIEVTWRKLNYYKFLGLLPKSIRKRGDKKGYYPASILYNLIIYDFLQHHLNLTLAEIKKLRTQFELPQDLEKLFEANVFSNWIDSTYGYYLRFKMRVLDKNPSAIVFGAIAIGEINHNYKYYLTKSAPFFKKNITRKTAKGNQIVNIARAAEKWAKT